jgi:hypothetical protein
MSQPHGVEGLMSVYTERAHLVAVLARIYPSHGYQPTDAEEGYQYAVCIHFPWGQGAWHIADNDFRNLFASWLLHTKDDYDGHTTIGKYGNMRQAVLDNDVQAFSVGGRSQ